MYALARHGDSHSIPPHAINYRANMYAFKKLGVDTVIALNTVGIVTSIREAGQVGIPDQILDYTWGREHTYLEVISDSVEHIDFTQPFAQALRQRLLAAAISADVDCYDGGVYAAMQGPRLETAAEVDRIERDGADYVGMTAMPEASLAAELGIDYACLAMIVNRAAGRGDRPIHGDVAANSATAKVLAIRILDHYFDNIVGKQP
jgi:5'-methylthioinosine phosphorylase